MCKSSQQKRVKTRPIAVGKVSALATQLDQELQRYLHGTPENRDELVTDCGQQLTYLKPIIDVLTIRSATREQAIRAYITRSQTESIMVPGPGTLLAGHLAVHLAQALYPYLTTTAANRDRLDNRCGHIFDEIYMVLSTLMIRDRDEREEHIMFDVELASAISKAFSEAMQEIYGNKRRSSLGRHK